MIYKNIQKFLSLVGLILLCAVSLASAAPVELHSCRGCDQQTMEYLAESYGPGFWYIYDIRANVLRYIHAKSISDDNSQFLAIELTPAANVAAYFATYQSLYAQNGYSEKFHPLLNINYPSQFNSVNGGRIVDNGSINAYDTVQWSSADNMITDYLMKGPGIGSAFIQELFTMFKSTVANADGMSAWIHVVFTDGSSRDYVYDSHTKRYTAIKNSAIDSHMNTIPDPNNKPANASYTFNTGNGAGVGSYDQTNIAWIFQQQLGVDQVGLAGQCAQIQVQGDNVKCIHPF